MEQCVFDDDGGRGPNYFPNSLGGPQPDPSDAMPELGVQGVIARHKYRPLNSEDDYIQPRTLFERVMDDEERIRLIGNIVAKLRDAREWVRYRQAAIFYRTHPEYGARVAKVVGLTSARVVELAALDDEFLSETITR